MAFWQDGRDMDHVIRRSDAAFNVTVLLMAAAFTLMFGAYRYGQISVLNERPAAGAAAPTVPAPPTNP
jgi:hypothetical protein